MRSKILRHFNSRNKNLIQSRNNSSMFLNWTNILSTHKSLNDPSAQDKEEHKIGSNKHKMRRKGKYSDPLKPLSIIWDPTREKF